MLGPGERGWLTFARWSVPAWSFERAEVGPGVTRQAGLGWLVGPVCLGLVG
ncbi:hypothetical protein HNR61_007138 [Actinomadura namibiensis]|uniref:Uncharacterized protein n=1 Tax=Actinomadura namibiensis TaxID=182080 RepID=A0A7W3LWC2_ACTNM|nr:hypothetical protein [Actinomadura namibiensis]